MVRSLALGALLAAAMTFPAASQTGAPADPRRTGSCEDSVGMHARDTAEVYVVAALRPFDSTAAVPRQLLELALYEIGSRFRPPTPLALLAYGGGEDIRERWQPDAFGHLVVNAMYRLELRRDGGGTRPAVMTTSLNAFLDQRVVEAIRAADSAGALPLLPDEVRGRSVELRLFLMTKSAPSTALSEVVLFRLRTPRVQFSEVVWPIPDRRNVPRYPMELRERGVNGSVMTQFVVNRDGAVELRTLNIPHATHIEFAKAVLQVLPRMRFTPARVGTCPVAQLVQMPFEFTVTR